MSLAGAQDKLPVALVDGRIAIPLNGTPSTHILKPDIRRLKGSVQNEAFCVILAGLVGLDVAKVTTGRAGARAYLLVERYDRRISDRGVRRIHQEDFCQVLGIFPSEKYEFDAEGRRRGPGIRQLFERHCDPCLAGRAPRPPRRADLQRPGLQQRRSCQELLDHDRRRRLHQARSALRPDVQCRLAQDHHAPAASDRRPQGGCPPSSPRLADSGSRGGPQSGTDVTASGGALCRRRLDGPGRPATWSPQCLPATIRSWTASARPSRKDAAGSSGSSRWRAMTVMLMATNTGATMTDHDGERIGTAAAAS